MIILFIFLFLFFFPIFSQEVRIRAPCAPPDPPLGTTLFWKNFTVAPLLRAWGLKPWLAGLSLMSLGEQRILSTEDQVVCTEILRCLDIVESNSSFSAANSDNVKYKLMFPDLKIASSYRQKVEADGSRRVAKFLQESILIAFDFI